MLKIYTPSGKETTMNEIIEDFKSDNIILKEPPSELLETFSKYYKPLQAKVLANRYEDSKEIEKLNNTRLSDILRNDFLKERLPDLDKASETILEVIRNNGHIMLISDYDVDGVTSATIGYKFITEVFDYDNIEVVVNKRTYGNGINNTIMEKTISYNKKKKIDLIITSDHGSHNKVNLDKIKEATGCKIIVTDHHLFEPEEAPLNQDAFINPQRMDESEMKDMTGTGVLYFTLLYAYNNYRENDDKANYIYYLLNYVGMTIISDCVDLRNYINRKILVKAIWNINSIHSKHDAFWSHIRSLFSSNSYINETVLGYNVIPLLNSPGRMGEPRAPFELMTSKDIDEVRELYEDIKNINVSRKELQSNATQQDNISEYSNKIVKVMCVPDADGVQGIIANNIMFDGNYKVVICFSESNGILVGSGRSQDENLNLRDIIANISNNSDIVVSFGGHSKAIGIKIKDDLKTFYNLLKDEIKKNEVKEIKVYKADEYIFSVNKLLVTIFDLLKISPFGIGFERPLFVSDMLVSSYRLIHKQSGYLLSAKVKFNNSNTANINLFYNIKATEVEYFKEMLKKTKYVRMVYSIDINNFRNTNKILLKPANIIFKEGA